MENHKNIASLLKTMHIPEFQKQNDFHVLKFKDHLDRIPLQTNERKCDFFQVFFSDKYNVEVAVGNNHFSAKDKTILSFLAPLQTLSVDVKSIEELSNGYMICFKTSFLQNAWSDFDVQRHFPFFNSNYSPVYFLNEYQQDFAELFKKIYFLFQDLNDENLEIIRAYLKILLYESRKAFFEGNIETSLKTRAEQKAFAFESLIKQYVHQREPLSFYADQLHISVAYLSECVKKATGKTAKQLIKEYTILEATTLLTQSSKTVDEIADILGFSATSNFINFFKKETKHTPLHYRKNNNF